MSQARRKDSPRRHNRGSPRNDSRRMESPYHDRRYDGYQYEERYERNIAGNDWCGDRRDNQRVQPSS